jgi:hypothetical protein
MSEILPSYLDRGDPARLFPVLSMTSKEGRTTSIVLACLSKVNEFGAEVLGQLGQRVGARTDIETYTEVVFKQRSGKNTDRPDGLIVLKAGKKEWRALVEAKVGNSDLSAEQVERYRQIAKEHDINCVVTLSNQFATTASFHPLEEIRKSRSKIPVYHLSWMSILTTADLLIRQNGVADVDQKILLNELRRFLTHESSGVRGFDRMPKEWGEINKLISSGGEIPSKSEDADTVIEAWHQETRDLSLILSRMTEANVSERFMRKYKLNRVERIKDDIALLRDKKQLIATLDIPDAAAPLEVIADITRRCVDVGMSLRAPDDKVTTKARLNWLLRQIKSEKIDDLYIRIMWPGGAAPTQYSAIKLRENPDIALEDKEHLTPHSFHIFNSIRLGTRFTQQVNFISDLEVVVPTFYHDIGSHLKAWQRPAPKIKKDKSNPISVSTGAISEDAQEYEP